MARSGIGKTLGMLAESASKKSNAIVESARLNTEINRILSEIDEFQYEIGKAYYADNKHKSTGPYIEMVGKVNNLEHELRIRNEKLLALKGLQYCKGCDAIVASGDEFCSKCGTPVPRSKWQAPESECRNCAEPIADASAQYCAKCGIRFN